MALMIRHAGTSEPRARQLRDAKQSCRYPTHAYQLDRPSSQDEPAASLIEPASTKVNAKLGQDPHRPIDNGNHINA